MTRYTFLMSVFLLITVAGSNSLLDASLRNHLSKGADSISESDQFARFMYVVTVDPTANDNETCHPPEQRRSSVTCKNLNHVLQMYYGVSSVVFYLAASEEIYYQNFTYNVTNQHNVWFYGNSSLPHGLIPTVKCLRNVGLSFINSSNISFSNLKFINCRCVQNSTSKDFLNKSKFHLLHIRVGLYFYNCTNVTMHQIQVLNSSQAIGVVMYDTDGQVEICDSVFANNSVHDNSSQSGGGGFAVEFTYCKPGDSTCNDTYDPLYKRNKNSTYSFHNCTFQENFAINPALLHVYNNVKVSKYNTETTGNGGGLSIHIKGDAKNNSFSLTDCRFIKNGAMWGGGLHIEMDDQSSNNSIVLSGCNFSNNRAGLVQHDTYTGGGAIDTITTTHNFNMFQIRNCNFTYNQAIEGGGILLSVARQANVNQPLEILIANCLFESNTARLGSAMVISNFPIFTSGVLPEIHIRDSSFSSNHYWHASAEFHISGIAAVYISDVHVSFQNHAIFNSNVGSALIAVGTQLDFSNTTTYFRNNSGSHGGAIALLGDAFIRIGPTTKMTFVSNNATQYGGAIYNRYISEEHLMSNADCFLRYSEPLTEPDNWTAQFNFSGNMAHIGGCSIFTSSITPCTWKSGHDTFRWKYWHYDRNNSRCEHDKEIFTEPKKFNSSRQDWSLSDPIKVFPGDIFTIPLSAYDDLGNNVTNYTIYSAQMLDDHSKTVADIGHGFTYIVSNYMSITGKPGSNIKLQLQTEGFRTMHVVLNVTIQSCPPGFICSENDIDCNSIANIKEMKCQCPTEKYTYQGRLSCDSYQFVSRININYWYGSVHLKRSNTTLRLMGRIPQVYRSTVVPSGTIELPTNIDEVDEKLCGHVSRRGALCGECIEDYAVAVNSRNYKCVPCNDNSTSPGEFVKFLCAYVTLTYLPIMVFFILIISFDIKLASSAAAGFVLYAQIVSTGNFLYPQAPYWAPQVIRNVQMTIYGIFNLESFAFLIDPFCLNPNFTTLHVLCLDYAIALFPLVMIVIIYLPYKCKLLCCKCHCGRGQGTEIEIDPGPDSTTSVRSISASQRPCCNKPPKSTLIHAFTAFMLLSYTKFGLASMKTVFITKLFDAKGTTKTHRIFLAGHLSFSDRQFLLPFGILAILVLVFIVFLPPLLLLGPIQFIDWLADKPQFGFIRRFWPSITIHTFLDTFQGYKPNRRFFAGLHLLFRLVLFLAFSFTPDLLSQYTIQLIVILVFFTLVSLLRPYAKEYYNHLDTLLFLNLGVLNAITIYVSEHHYTRGIYTLECILLFLPMVYIICYIVWNKVRKRKHYKKVKENISRRLVNPVKSSGEEREKLLKSNSTGDDPFGESINYSSDDPDEEIFRRAARGNRFRTAITETHLPSKPGGVPKTVVSILDPQMPKNEEERSSTNKSDSGIGRQSNSGRSTWSNT